ncbi:MAG: TatD family hydrolase [Candidatus Yonathbacteria bacterium]|nr:TatD family hydrolase [Candidatus Yonathbacteria bacterium]
MPQFFDIHAHVNDVRYDEDRNNVLARMREREVFAIMVGTDYKSSQDVAMMASFVDDGVYATIGVHPNDTDGLFREEIFTDLLAVRRVVAVGECGLDYSRLGDIPDVVLEKKRQRELFSAQIDFAIAHDLPLMLHVRDSEGLARPGRVSRHSSGDLSADSDAHRDTIAILNEKKKNASARLRGNVHFFSQTIDIAREYFAIDFTISFTGVITFSHEYDEVVRLAPLDRIMSETDCPYVTPMPYRGKRNEPIFVEEVVKRIAEIRGEDFETVRTALVQNALRTFNITP